MFVKSLLDMRLQLDKQFLDIGLALLFPITYLFCLRFTTMLVIFYCILRLHSHARLSSDFFTPWGLAANLEFPSRTTGIP